MNAPLDLKPEWITRDGDKVIAAKVESQRARQAYSRKRSAEIKRALAVFA